jgi:AraC-like DNA-binding protein
VVTGRRAEETRDRIRFHAFPLAGVDAMSAATDRAFPRHTHDLYGVGVVDAGGHTSWSGRGQVQAGPGTVITVNPGEVHDGSPVGGRPRAWRILYVEPALMAGTCADVRDGTSGDFTFAAPAFADARVRDALNAAFAFAMVATSSDAMACEAALLALVARLQAHAASPPRVRHAPSACVRRARARIDDDPAAPVTLAELAGEAGLSRYRLLRAFARELGLPPHAYIVQRRLTLARRLIRARVALAEVAVRAGFYDQSHLTRCFVRHVGVTPRRYAGAG